VTFTFDTGMLIALERRKSSAIRAFQSMVRRGHVPVVPAPVYAEWWRGKTAVREDLSKAFSLEPMSSLLCRATGEALAAVRGATLVDACVMASAALRGGGIVYTADVDDLRKLQALFPTVALIAV
jgi:hypothetical protein